MNSKIEHGTIIYISKVYVAEYEIDNVGFYFVHKDFDVFDLAKGKDFISDVDSVLNELVETDTIGKLINYQHGKYCNLLILRQGECRHPVEYERIYKMENIE